MNIKDIIKYDLPASLVVFLVALPLCLGVALASGAPLFSGVVAGIVGVEGATSLKIHTPLISLSKAEIVRFGVNLGVPFGLTWSCYDPGAGGKPCGGCDSCVLRAKGFSEAGVADPAVGTPAC